MVLALKIDSNNTSLAIAEEASIGVLPGSPVWLTLEPNSYSDFGGEISTVSRRPINAGRQLQKGAVVDLNANGGFEADVTQNNTFSLLQGFAFADMRRKGFVGNAIGVTTNTIEVTNATTFTRIGGAISLVTEGFAVNNIIFVSGFANAANNGPFLITSTTATTAVVTKLDGTAANLVVEAATANASIERVGHQFATADATITAGGFPTLGTTIKDLTTFGLFAGDWIFIGGDVANSSFATAADNGFARVNSVATNAITFSKTGATFTTDTGAGKKVMIFFGSVIKNESDPTLIKRRSYQLERQLGAVDLAAPTQIQSEYVVGAVPNKFDLKVPLAGKLTATLGYMGTDNEQRTGVVGVKAGARVTPASGNAINTSSDISRIRLSVCSTSSANVTPLLGYIMSMDLNINNHVKAAKAISKLGAFDMTAGVFEVTGGIQAFFTDIAAVTAVRNNADVTLDTHFVANNSGLSVDIPLIQLSKGRLNVRLDEAIMIPLDEDAASGSKYGLNHTVLFVQWPYLPLAADV